MFVKIIQSASKSFLICSGVIALVFSSAVCSVPSCVDEDPRDQYSTVHDSIIFNIDNLTCEVNYELLLGNNSLFSDCNEYVRESAISARNNLITKYHDSDIDLKDLQPNCFHRIDLDPIFISSKLVCYREDGFMFYGGPWSNDGRWHLLIRREEGLVKASLSELLNLTGSCLATIATYVENCLLTERASYVLDGTYSINYEKLKDVGVTKFGLCYVFDKYEIGCGVEGGFQVIVPWSLIKDYIQKDGILFEMLKEQKANVR